MFPDEHNVARKWREHSRACRTKHGIGMQYYPWTRNSPNFTGLPRIPPRMRELLDIAWATHVKDVPLIKWEEHGKVFFVDLSQSVEREPWGHLGLVARGAFYVSLESCFAVVACIAIPFDLMHGNPVCDWARMHFVCIDWLVVL